jgi:hypothetical protein
MRLGLTFGPIAFAVISIPGVAAETCSILSNSNNNIGVSWQVGTGIYFYDEPATVNSTPGMFVTQTVRRPRGRILPGWRSPTSPRAAPWTRSGIPFGRICGLFHNLTPLPEFEQLRSPGPRAIRPRSRPFNSGLSPIAPTR